MNTATPKTQQEVLEESLETTGYTTFQRTNPKLLRTIGAFLEKGATPAQIEKIARKLVPVTPAQGELTMNLVFYTAQYMQKNGLRE